MKQILVQIIEYKTNEVVEEIKCKNQRDADRVDRGININLNHDEFYTMIQDTL